MAEVESDFDAPPGFKAITLAGIGMVARMLEPEDSVDWATLVAGLEPWGEVPDPKLIRVIEVNHTERGITAWLKLARQFGDIETGGDLWAEFLPWGSDGRLRARAKAAPENWNVPSGGYSWEGSDIIIVRRVMLTGWSDDIVAGALNANDMEAAQAELRNAGRVLGHYHTRAMAARTTPPNPSKWNARNQWLEETLQATFIWRAPYSKNQPCTLSLGDVRFSDIATNPNTDVSWLTIGRPRLADALRTHTCEFPAMRDLASLVHDLSRIHHSSRFTSLDQTPLRLALIEGWKSTAPADWASDDAFYAHRGGLAIWEYEQCLLDVLEATSHQSGAPEPAVTTLAYVKAYQKRMFSNRTYGALSIMAAFFGITSLVNTFPPALGEIPIPIACLALSYWLYGVYRRMSPPPERPFTHLGR